jgi:uncharacterized membrane protein
MITDSSVEIEAPAPVVWEVYADVARWPDWTASVTSVVPLDGPEIEVGKRFEIKQPRMPKLVWEVTEVEPGTSWTWRQHSPGGTTFASHELVVRDGNTLVRQRIDQRGPIGVVVGVLMRRRTKRYLALESQGLKASSEQLRRRDGSPA